MFQQRFGEGDVFVRGAGGGVDEEVVEWGPEDVGEELADHGCLFWAAPDDGGGAGGEEEGEGDGVEGADFGTGLGGCGCVVVGAVCCCCR